MNFFKLYLLKFCPINLLYPTFEDRFPQIYKHSMIFAFDEAIDHDIATYNKRLREVYEIPEEDDVFVYNYKSYMDFFNHELKGKDLSHATIRKINKYGCLHKAKYPIYRGLTDFVGDRVMEHHYLYHTIIIIFVTNFSCLLSSFQFVKNRYVQFAFTSLMILIPHLLVMYLSDAIYLALTIFLLFGAIIIRYLVKKPWRNKEEQPLENGFIYYVNFARGTLIVAIIIVILGVDNISFNQFMRKTYYDGFSAMDIGAGFFVTQTGSSIALSRRKKNVWVILKKNIIVFSIAVIRTISTAALGYDVDEREYGRHWNFFYTLAITRIAVDLIHTYCHKYVVWALPVVIATVYEIILISTGAIRKLPTLSRSNIIYANREGLLSIPNSVSGSLIVLIITKIAVEYYKKGNKYHAFLTYMFCSLSFFFVANILYFAKLKSSRSMNNLRYLLYVMFLYNFALGSMVMFEILYPRYKENQVIDSIGKYPLMVYLIANLMTGFVNMVFKPYLMPLTYFIIILVVYSYILFFSGLTFRRFKIKNMSQWL